MGVVEQCRPQDRNQFWEAMGRCKAFLYTLALLWAVLAITPTLDREVINSPPASLIRKDASHDCDVTNQEDPPREAQPQYGRAEDRKMGGK
jgi:hypothetical protein